ncbi:MAG TPA: carboxypeptidase-like regulatory domain-containing protein [Blastocatellia bacterium]|nr:carboxypeptidase-like regulatory domain-containing protein [Blastocatellia bacterium]
MKAILTSIITLLLTFAIPSSTSIVAQQLVLIKGTVAGGPDSFATVLPGVRIIFSSEGRKYVTTTDEYGTYEIRVPAGIYQVTPDSPGFCSYKRAAFSAEPANKIIINIVPTVCGLANIIQSESPIEMENLPENRRLLIRYIKRTENKECIEYGGIEINTYDHLSAIASYNLLTIYADKIRFDKTTWVLEAEGHVWFEDGKQGSRLSKVEIDFRPQEPLIMVTE